MMIYLDNAATSFPKPSQVNDRMIQFLREEAANPGRSGHRLSVAAEKAVDQTRDLVAKFFNAKDVNRVIFTLNGTDSLNIAIKGLVRKGIHVISTVAEHNSVLRPLAHLEDEGEISVTHVDVDDEGRINVEDVKKAWKENTKIVVMTHASNVLGTIQPIREVGQFVREKGGWFILDAAQSAGHLPIDLEKDPIDILALPGHKGLFGPPGTGILYIGERIQVGDIKAWRIGGTGADSESRVQPNELPYLLEGGTPNTAGIAGLGEGIRFLNKQGLDQIRQHEIDLMKQLVSGLKGIEHLKMYGPVNPEDRVAAVLVNVEGLEPADLGSILDESFQIAVRTGLHCAPLIHKRLGTSPLGGVRISPGFFTTKDDIDKTISAFREIVAQTFAS